MKVKERNVALCVVLTIITCGIYGIYWMIVMNNDALIASGQEGTDGVMVFVLSLVTCGIYGIYWAYRMGQRMDIMQGNPGGFSPILFILLSLFGLGIIWFVLMQLELNRHA